MKPLEGYFSNRILSHTSDRVCNRILVRVWNCVSNHVCNRVSERFLNRIKHNVYKCTKNI